MSNIQGICGKKSDGNGAGDASELHGSAATKVLEVTEWPG
jgi:hypothetical protein